MGSVLAHPTSVTGGIWAGEVAVVSLPLPPDRPQVELAHLPALISTLGTDAAVCLLQLAARVSFDARRGWYVLAATASVAQWNGWGMSRARTALVSLETAGLVRRTQLLQDNGRGGWRRGSGVLALLPNSEPAFAVEVAMPSPSAPSRSWGPEFPSATLVAVLEEMEFENASATVELYGAQVVSDAVRATLYRALRGKVGNCGAYVRRILTRGEVATPPPGLAKDWLANPADVLDAVRATAPQDQLAKARSKLAARGAAVTAVWSSLPTPEQQALDEELAAYLSTTTLLPPHRQEWARVEMMEGLLAERGLLAQLPPDPTQQ